MKARDIGLLESLQAWLIDSAGVGDEIAAVLKAAAARELPQVGNHSANGRKALPSVAYARKTAQQPSCVRVLRCPKESPSFRMLDDFARIHDCDLVRKLRHHP